MRGQAQLEAFETAGRLVARSWQALPAWAEDIKRRLAEEFREQLTVGVPTDDDEAGLRRLAAAHAQEEARPALADQVVRCVHAIRADREMLKPPGVAETLDWARALHELGTRTLDTETAAATLPSRGGKAARRPRPAPARPRWPSRHPR